MTHAATRKVDLRHLLSEHRRQIQDEIGSRIRDGRANRAQEVRDDLERSDAAIQGDIALALVQMKAETLRRIDEALVRLDLGQYGRCFECEREIAQRRLRALPFAVRCQACQERREQTQERARRLAEGRAGFSLFQDVTAP
jgi:DnaK suppressor protein